MVWSTGNRERLGSGGQNQFSVLGDTQPVFAAAMFNDEFAGAAQQGLTADPHLLSRSTCNRVRRGVLNSSLFVLGIHGRER